MNATSDAHDGGCPCRHVRYRMHGAPLFVHCCHCRWCQRESGASFALNAMIEADRVEVLAGDVDAVRFVRVGTLDAPDRLPPDIHIFTSSKQPWVILPPGVPAVPEYYDRDDHWPKASLERRAALLARVGRTPTPG